MSSGVKVHPDCTAEFEKLKMKQEYRYIVFKLSDNLEEIVVDVTAPAAATYQDLMDYLVEVMERKECRYAAIDLGFEFKGAAKKKIVFISWNPENAELKPKMVYTTSKGYLKKALKLTIEVTGTDLDEISLESVQERARRGMKD